MRSELQRTRVRVAGFTMVELLVASTILSIVMVYLLDTFTVNQRAYQVVDQVAEAQQNTRAIGDLIERDIRHAGFMVPAQASVCGIDNQNAPDVLFLSDSAAIDPGTTLAPTLGAAILGGLNVLNGVQTLVVDSVVVDGGPAYDTNGDTVKDSDFQLNYGVIIADREQPDRGAACGTVIGVVPATNTIVVDIATGGLLTGGFPSELIAVPANAYTLGGPNGTLLTRNNMPLAEDVEDLQFAVSVDLNGDFQQDPGEYLGDGNAPAFAAANSAMLPRIDPHDYREVRVSFVLRTRRADQNFNTGQFQATENRVAVAGNDGFRRRVHTSVARLRNVMNRTTL